MRIYLKLTNNNKPVPFNYQQNLVGAFYKWIGRDQIHNKMSLYSMSWLSAGKKKTDKLNFPAGAIWFISSPKEQLIKKVITGIQQSPEIAFGMSVYEVMIKETPKFSDSAKFHVATPVLVKRDKEQNTIQYKFNDEGVNDLLTETLRRKLRLANIDDSNVFVEFDNNDTRAKTKLVTYKGIGNKANLCSVIVKGSEEAVAFAWDVGIGNSTGIGFGSLH